MFRNIEILSRLFVCASKFNFEDRYKKHNSNLSKELLSKVYYKKIGEIGKFNIFLINGEVIRNNIDIDFLFGGNPGPYPYVPDNEIWIEKTLAPIDFGATLLHELIENYYMEDADKETYEKAHHKAEEIEKFLREAYKDKEASQKDYINIVSDILKKFHINFDD